MNTNNSESTNSQSCQTAVISRYIVFKRVNGEWEQESIILTDIDNARVFRNDIKKRGWDAMMCMIVE